MDTGEWKLYEFVGPSSSGIFNSMWSFLILQSVSCFVLYFFLVIVSGREQWSLRRSWQNGFPDFPDWFSWVWIHPVLFILVINFKITIIVIIIIICLQRQQTTQHWEKKLYCQQNFKPLLFPLKERWSLPLPLWGPVGDGWLELVSVSVDRGGIRIWFSLNF